MNYTKTLSVSFSTPSEELWILIRFLRAPNTDVSMYKPHPWFLASILWKNVRLIHGRLRYYVSTACYCSASSFEIIYVPLLSLAGVRGRSLNESFNFLMDWSLGTKMTWKYLFVPWSCLCDFSISTAKKLSCVIFFYFLPIHWRSFFHV